MKKLLIIISISVLLIACNSQKRCARFVAKHPDCFKDTVLRDTVLVESHKLDTTFFVSHDTVKTIIKTPCGDIEISKNTDGSFNLYQSGEQKVITKTVITNLPCPCNCDSLKSKLRKYIKENSKLKKQLRKSNRKKKFSFFGGFMDTLKWIFIVLVVGVLVILLFRFYKLLK